MDNHEIIAAATNNIESKSSETEVDGNREETFLTLEKGTRNISSKCYTISTPIHILNLKRRKDALRIGKCKSNVKQKKKTDIFLQI